MTTRMTAPPRHLSLRSDRSQNSTGDPAGSAVLVTRPSRVPPLEVGHLLLGAQQRFVALPPSCRLLLLGRAARGARPPCSGSAQGLDLPSSGTWVESPKPPRRRRLVKADLTSPIQGTMDPLQVADSGGFLPRQLLFEVPRVWWRFTLKKLCWCSQSFSNLFQQVFRDVRGAQSSTMHSRTYLRLKSMHAGT